MSTRVSRTAQANAVPPPGGPDPDAAGPTPNMPAARRFWCPRCHMRFKRGSCLKRHAFEHCYQLKEWLCFLCEISFKRQARFEKHHKERHGCGLDDVPCIHAQVVERIMPQPAALTCGFCGATYHVGPAGPVGHVVNFLEHIFQEMKAGRTRGDWNLDVAADPQARMDNTAFAQDSAETGHYGNRDGRPYGSDEMPGHGQHISVQETPEASHLPYDYWQEFFWYT